ncbi:MAG: alpha/beta hydrolase [Gammaproteobacteria bacterium]|nr:alpha/beta hydrolase [Gammaproteobacteria bacterium]
MNKQSVYVGLASILLAACGGGGGAGGASSASLACSSTSDDSPRGFTFDRINSKDHGNPVYHSIDSDRNPGLTIDYMVHPSVGTPKALLVLIQGGNGDANIDGFNETVFSAGGNFLVRSAHLYARQGYKVVSLDRPIDEVGGNDAFNRYRASVKHAVDLSTVINKEQIAGLPVIISGTSRGAISALAQHQLADAIAVSSPVTNDPNESAAVFEGSSNPMLRPSSVSVPTHVMWHVNDACSVSPAAGSSKLATDFNPDAKMVAISGGYDATDKQTNCKGHTVHGFYGIETCAVEQETKWMDGLELEGNKPKATSQTYTYSNINGADIGKLVEPSKEGAKLTISLPFSKTSEGGEVSIKDDIISYTVPDHLKEYEIKPYGDSFVYVVKEEGGGTSHNTVVILDPK